MTHDETWLDGYRLGLGAAIRVADAIAHAAQTDPDTITALAALGDVPAADVIVDTMRALARRLRHASAASSLAERPEENHD